MSLDSIARRDEPFGKEVATDLINGKHYQRFTLYDSSGNPVSPGSTSALSVGNIISDGAIAVATINGGGSGGVNLLTITTNTIISIFIFSTLTSVIEISFDAGATWVRLPADFNPTVEWGNKGRKITSDVKVRAVGTVTGTDITAWGMI